MGVLMYECLAGVRPTEASNLGQIFKLITIGPMAPLAEKAPNVPATFAKVVGWCLERARDARPASARDLRDALERVRAGSSLDGAVVAAHAPPPPSLAPPKSGNGKVIAIAASALVVLGLAGGAFGVGMKSRRTPPATPTVVAEAPPTPPPAEPAPPPVPSSSESAPAAKAPPASTASAAVRAVKPAKTPKAAPAAGGASASEDERAAGKVIAKPPF
jgi:serine/threonine-protein kinase